MIDVLPDQLPWWIAGPGMGLCVVALYGLVNVRLGVSGSWLATAVAPMERWRGERWRVEFLMALVAGAGLAALLGSGFQLSLYGPGAFPLAPGAAPALLVPLLLVAGLALGYGARWAGGCTSGHGLAGCPTGSPDSLVTTATFFTVAVAVTLVVGGAAGALL